MSLVTLSDVLKPAMREGYAVAGLVTLGWEDMRAYVEAAQGVGVPVILQAGPSCREHTPIPVLSSMFKCLAESVDIPVVAHLDHGYTYDECKVALEYGFTSLMYDGSRKPINQNIDETAAIVEMAHQNGISCEGEIGFVGYNNGEKSAGTIPAEAEKFAKETGVDAMAISCGNMHLQENKQGGLDIARIRAIEALTNLPLVIHGGSGVPVSQRKILSATSNICKFNIGTELRKVFGEVLRNVINSDDKRYDRVQILKDTISPLRKVTEEVLRTFSNPNCKV